jgi:hypothetical protein
MKTVLPEASMVIKIPFVDNEGIELAPTALSYSLMDETGALIDDVPFVPVPIENEVEITILGPLNALASNEIRGLRTIRLNMIDGNGVLHIRDESYLVERADTLLFGINSFQTYPQALLTMLEISSINILGGLPRGQQIRALQESYHRLCRLNFSIRNTGLGGQSYLNVGSQSFSGTLTDLQPSELEALGARFLGALRLAQIVEADVIVGGDPTAERRRDGLMSETIGESSNMFRPGKPVILSVSDRALRYLAGYISYSTRLSRAR